MKTHEPPLSLEQYAGIVAGLSANIPPAELYAQEQVTEAEHRAAEQVWRERIVESVPLSLEYTQKLHVAEDTLARKLSPIDDDEQAWVGLLGALATSDDQAALLAGLGITMADVGRLGRVWRRRARADEALAKRMVELAADPKPPSAIVVGPSKLRPFPWTPKARDPVAAERVAADPSEELSAPSAEPVAVKRELASFQRVAAPPAAAAPAPAPPAPLPPAPQQVADPFASWTVEHYARLARELRARPSESDAVMSQAGLLSAESRRQVHEHFRARFEREPGLRAQFDALLGPASGRGPTGTDELDNRALKRRPATIPFERPTGAGPDSQRKRAQRKADERLAKHSPEDAALLMRMKALKHSASPAETTAVDETQLKKPLPFASSGAAQMVESSLERYAALVAQLRQAPERAENTHLTFGLSAAEAPRVHGAWRDRFAQDPALKDKLEKLVAAALANG